MKRRVRKKVEKRKREVLHQILDAVININGLQKSSAEITGSHPTAFLNFYGHTGTIDVSIDNNGWKADIQHDKSLRACVDKPEELRRVLENLEVGD